MRAAARLLALLLLAAVLRPAVAQAHEMRPMLVGIDQLSERDYRIAVAVPDSVPEGNYPEIRLPPHCAPATVAAARKVANVRCDGALPGSAIAIAYPHFNPAVSTMIRYEALDGAEHAALLPPDTARWTVPTEAAQPAVALSYARAGVHHILSGIDHLLFVACIFALCGGLRRIVTAVTGFTLGHSVTLAASSLGWVRVPIAPTEVLIALSICLLAAELVRGRRDSLIFRHPFTVTAAFGLLHGLGFASALQEMGLPERYRFTGLLSFNLGVEAGQLLFVGLLALAAALVSRAGRLPRLRPLAGRIAVQPLLFYGVGILAAYWAIDRLP